MKNLTFLLYILTKSISSIKPSLIEALQDWPVLTHNLNLANINLKKFCAQLHLNQEQTDKFVKNYKAESVDNYFSLLNESQTKTINIFELSYPTQLLQIPDPPLILYYRGKDKKLLESASLAMVGSRKASLYGKMVVQKMLSELSGTGLTLISGLAYGIDAEVHQSALTHSLPTIAVLGGGIDDATIYPKNNFTLAQQILHSGGLLISEYPPKSSAFKHQFIARNRIIAGLAKATVVIEAANNSGALLTADFALDYNKSVYAVPGQIFSHQSQGTNHLIDQGAQVLNSVQKLYDEFGYLQSKSVEQKLSFSAEQLAVLKCMQSDGWATTLEDLVAKSGLTLSQILAVTAELELKNIITQTSPQIYQKKI